ncbi:hypothetical protein BDZ97DRAFT_1601957, partial [Flammula alnicola]
RRSELKRIAQATLATLHRGFYTVKGVDYVLIRKINESQQNTRFYHPHDAWIKQWATSKPKKQWNPESAPTYISVLNSTTLDAARSLETLYRENAKEQWPTGVLSSASPGQPGGNFKAGDEGQELSISRSSTLYSSLTTDEAAKFYRTRNHDAYNTHAMVYSPGVTVFRDDIGKWTYPFDIDVLSCAAVHAADVRTAVSFSPANSTSRQLVDRRIKQAMKERMARILYVFEQRGVRNLVLGAFGAGNFENNITTVARIWAKLLIAPGARFAASFDRVIFAVMPESAFKEFQSAFYAAGSAV